MFCLFLLTFQTSKGNSYLDGCRKVFWMPYPPPFLFDRQIYLHIWEVFVLSGGGRGHWAVYSYSLAGQRWKLLLNLIGWFIKLSVQTFQPLIVIYRKGNFVYRDWGCTSICRSLSYPFRLLNNISFFYSVTISPSMHTTKEKSTKHLHTLLIKVFTCILLFTWLIKHK